MKSKVMVTGARGQGALELGDHIGHVSLLNGIHVSSIPTHMKTEDEVGCCLVLSSGEASSPVVEDVDYLISMGDAPARSLSLLRKGGTLVMESSVASVAEGRDDIDVVRVPAVAIVEELTRGRSERVDDRTLTASVMLGVYLALSLQEFDYDLVRDAYNHFPPEVPVSLALRIQAVHRGYEFVRSSEPMVEYGR